MTLDLDAVRDRSRRYLALSDRMDEHGQLPGLDSHSTAVAIGLAASISAADVPDLIDEIDRLTGTASANQPGSPNEGRTHQP